MPRPAAVAQIHRLFAVGTTASLAEGQLLDRFLDTGDEAAFEAILAAHGPMVLAVCRGMLADLHSADDAFQATFLILVKKARSIDRPDLLGPWLHGVAHKVAARSRSRSYRDKTSSDLDEIPQVSPAADDLDRRERARLLHEEVAGLPAKYRSPVVLCHLEGLSHDEAARRLGWPVGTVRGRLSRARDRLRVRLTRRGAAPAVGAIVAALAADTRAGVPSALMHRTLTLALQQATTKAGAALAASAVVALSREVSISMLFTPAKLAATGLAAAAMAAGVGVWAMQADDPPRGDRPPAAAKIAVDAPRPTASADLSPRLPQVSTAVRSTPDLSGSDEPRPASVHEGTRTLDTKQYLAKTRNEVDAGLATLSWQVADLENRLATARVGMARLKAVKEAIEAQHDDRGNPPSRVMPAPIALPMPDRDPLAAPPPEASVVLPPPGFPVQPPSTASPRLDPPPMPAPETGPPADIIAPSVVLPPTTAPESSVPPVVVPGQAIRVEVLEALPGRPISGIHKVRSDGTISLAYYGNGLKVAGLDEQQIKEKVVKHLRKYLSDLTLGLAEKDPMNPSQLRRVPNGVRDNDRVFVDIQPGDDDNSAAKRVRDLESKVDALVNSLRATGTNAPQPRVDSPATQSPTPILPAPAPIEPAPSLPAKVSPPAAPAATPVPPGDAASPAQPKPSLPAVRPGQAIRVQVSKGCLGDTRLDERVTVRADGTVGLVGIGEIKVAGLNREQIRKKMVESISQRVRTINHRDRSNPYSKHEPLIEPDDADVIIDDTIPPLPDGPDIRIQPEPPASPLPPPSMVVPPADAPPPPPVKVGQSIRLELLEALPGRPLGGIRVVRGDGTVNLDYYGDLYVNGMNRNQIKGKLIEHMRNILTDQALGLVEPDPADPSKLRPVAGGVERNDRVVVDDQPRGIDVDAAQRIKELERKIEGLDRSLRAASFNRPGPSDFAPIQPATAPQPTFNPPSPFIPPAQTEPPPALRPL